MRRYWREQQPTRMFRGAELTRLMTGIVMLAVIYMLIVRAHDADTWRWLANDGRKPAKQAIPKTPQPTPPLPAATGPTDEDPDQAEEAQNELQVLVDGGLTLQPEEQEPYDRLVYWVKNQSFARLRQRARADLLFTHFHDEPDKYRGQLATFDLNVRQIIDAGKNRDGIQLYEVCGSTSQSGNRLYWAIVVDLPKGMPTGPKVFEKARFAGYFFKLQGYYAAAAAPGQAPEKAPLFIGRLEWEPAAVASTADNTQEWTWGLALLGVIGLALGIGFVYRRLKPRKPLARQTVSDAATGEVISIDAWLERSNWNKDDEQHPDSFGS